MVLHKIQYNILFAEVRRNFVVFLSSMRSFIFCTSFITNQSPHLSVDRWNRWIAYYDLRRDLFGAERVIILDDASPVECLPPDLQVIDIAGGLPDSLPACPIMFRFNEHYGRYGLTIFPGWWRSFTFSVVIAKRYAFSKIIHCESDAFVLSPRLIKYIQQIREGWVAFWCPRHKFPETGLQVICHDAFKDLATFHGLGERLWFQHVFPERVLPFSRVQKDFIGDRYGEYLRDYPPDADYVCQSTQTMTINLLNTNNTDLLFQSP